MIKYVHQISYYQFNLRIPCSRSLRYSANIYLKTKIPKGKKYDHAFVHQCPLLWNSLSEEIKSIRKYKLFSTRVKKELLLNNPNFPE